MHRRTSSNSASANSPHRHVDPLRNIFLLHWGHLWWRCHLWALADFFVVDTFQNECFFCFWGPLISSKPHRQCLILPPDVQTSLFLLSALTGIKKDLFMNKVFVSEQIFCSDSVLNMNFIPEQIFGSDCGEDKPLSFWTRIDRPIRVCWRWVGNQKTKWKENQSWTQLNGNMEMWDKFEAMFQGKPSHVSRVPTIDNFHARTSGDFQSDWKEWQFTREKVWGVVKDRGGRRKQKKDAPPQRGVSPRFKTLHKAPPQRGVSPRFEFFFFELLVVVSVYWGLFLFAVPFPASLFPFFSLVVSSVRHHRMIPFISPLLLISRPSPAFSAWRSPL